MDILTVFLRTVFIYIAVFAVMRIMGKREIGKLSVFDLVISIMIAEIAVFVIEDIKKPMLSGLVPMVTLVGIQVTIAFVCLKSQRLRRWFDSAPSMLIERGKLNRQEMKKQRYNLDDLLLQLRENKIANLADVEFAILEPSGKLTAFTKEHLKEDKPAPAVQTAERERSAEPGKVNFRYEGLPLPLIMDGKVQDDSLEKLGKTRFWLKNQIQTKGVKEFKDVFFCSIDHRGHLFLDKKR